MHWMHKNKSYKHTQFVGEKLNAFGLNGLWDMQLQEHVMFLAIYKCYELKEKQFHKTLPANERTLQRGKFQYGSKSDTKRELFHSVSYQSSCTWSSKIFPIH
jgi:hypothetical protein